MKPVDQTEFGPANGNCMAACVATLLNLDIHEVPQLIGPEWASDLSTWLRQRDLDYVEIEGIRLASKLKLVLQEGTYCVLVGPSPRFEGCNHAVIGKAEDGMMRCEHDPHPDRAGIVTIENIGFIIHRTK